MCPSVVSRPELSRSRNMMACVLPPFCEAEQIVEACSNWLRQGSGERSWLAQASCRVRVARARHSATTRTDAQNPTEQPQHDHEREVCSSARASTDRAEH